MVQKTITPADMAGPELGLHAAHKFLNDNGVEWSFQWIKTQVSLGAIPSHKVFSSRVVLKIDLQKIVEDHKK